MSSAAFAAARSDGVACVGKARLTASLAALSRSMKSRRPPPSPLRLHRRLGKDGAARPCLMAAPPRARAPGGGSRSVLRASARTAGRPGRPPAGLIRPARSVPQVASRVAADGSPRAEVACWENHSRCASCPRPTDPSLPPIPSPLPTRRPCARRGPAPQLTSKPITHHRLVAFAFALSILLLLLLFPEPPPYPGGLSGRRPGSVSAGRRRPDEDLATRVARGEACAATYELEGDCEGEDEPTACERKRQNVRRRGRIFGRPALGPCFRRDDGGEGVRCWVPAYAGDVGYVPA